MDTMTNGTFIKQSMEDQYQSLKVSNKAYGSLCFDPG